MIHWNAASTKRGIIWVATALVGSVFVFMGKHVDQLLLLAGGGSGGNTSAATGADGAGTAGQGFAGGTGGGALKASGGGTAGAVGAVGTAGAFGAGGNGGAGVSNSITGAAVLYGGGDEPASWVQTSYNTRGNVHYDQNNEPDGGVALRGNYAGTGYIYDVSNDVFYEPQPNINWTLNKDTWLWEAPLDKLAEIGI